MRPPGQRVAVVGSRKYPDPDQVREFVRSLPLDTTVVSGGAAGVDSWAETEANKRGLVTCILRPDWDKHGRAAGLIRNAAIVDFCDSLTAFWDGESRGTAHAMRLTREAKKPLRVFRPRPRQAPISGLSLDEDNAPTTF